MPYIPGQGWTSSSGGIVKEYDDRTDPMVASRDARSKLATSILGLPGVMGVTTALLQPPTAAPPPQFPPLLPIIAGVAAGAGLVADILTPGAGLIRQDQPMQPAPYGVPFGGPGLKEPGGKYLLKEWHIRLDSKDGDFSLQFYLTQNDRGTKRIFMYNTRTKAWKSWAPPRLAVIGKNMPRHQMITRLRRNLKRHSADAVTILKLVNPNKLESTRRGGGRYVKGRKRWVD